MKKIIFAMPLVLLSFNVAAQNDNLLFDDGDIIVRTNTAQQNQDSNNNYDAAAAAMAKNLLKSAPRRLEPPKTVSFGSASPRKAKRHNLATFNAPFGLLWNASINETKAQGIELTPVDMKDYPDSFSATRLPKAINFFERVYISFGEEDELQRILAYSHAIEDDSHASKTIQYYKKYSENLEQKYGNMEQFFTPAPIEEKKEGNKDAPKPDNSIGNPNFLSQLADGTAVLYSTYHNDNISATLSIDVDGEQKSYIVIDYSNLQVIKQQDKTTYDAL